MRFFDSKSWYFSMKHAPNQKVHASVTSSRVTHASVSAQGTVEDDWWAFEEQRGPADWMDDEDFERALKIIASRCSIRGEPMRVPREAVFRVFEKVLDRCARNRNASPADRSAIARTRRLLTRVKPRKPKHRPRKSWWLKRQATMAVGELWRRVFELVYTEGLSRDDAIKKAAKEIAPGVPIGGGRSATARELSRPGCLTRSVFGGGGASAKQLGFQNSTSPHGHHPRESGPSAVQSSLVHSLASKS